MTDLGDFLEALGVQVRDRGGEQNVRCPYHEDRTASARLNLDKDVFFCNACGVNGSLYGLILHEEKGNRASAQARYQKLTGDSSGTVRGSPSGKSSGKVPVGEGFVPRYRRAISARVRRRPTGWT